MAKETPKTEEAPKTEGELGNSAPDQPKIGKQLDVTSEADAKAKISDVETVGDVDAWQLLCKASSKSGRWMKSTKAMKVGAGCLVQVTTQQGEQVAEAITYVPGVQILLDDNGGRKLVRL